MVNGKQTTINLDADTLMALQKELVAFSRLVESLQKKLARLFIAPYGSDTWWEQSIEQSREDYKAGRYTELKMKEEIQQFFYSSSNFSFF